MHSPKDNRPSLRIYLIMAAAVIVLLLLAVSVSQLELQEGYTVPIAEQDVGGIMEENPPTTSGEIFEAIMRGIFALTLVALPIYIIQSLFSPEGRRRLLVNILIIAMLFVFLSLLNETEENPQEFLQEEETEMSGDPFEFLAEDPDAEPVPEMPEEAPPWVNTLVIILLVGLILAIVVGIYLYVERQRRRRMSALDQVAEQAQDAIDKLRAGADFNSTILQCYYEMNRIISEELELRRSGSMTARDFEGYLIDKGIPYRPIDDLTKLFERARYSNRAPASS
ncbi:MAG: DUF4129 domain-containing protein, partial [Anaerolineae bacterium]|nr:DUF4129 domain-containing protein [Anaerolineae bacterium]